MVLGVPIFKHFRVDFWSKKVYPLYTGRLFHCDMLDESICHFSGVRSILSLLFYF